MGRKQDALVSLLEAEGEITQHPRPTRTDLIGADLGSEVDLLYRRLGGILETWQAKPGRWDAVFDGIAVELDEQLHFNRYQLVTLDSPVYARIPTFPLALYRAQCHAREAECLRAGRYGGKWTNSSCERLFGPPGAAGDLDGAGAPRWRQRAFYDFIKDLAPLAIDLAMARLSIWEPLPGDQEGRAIEGCLRHPSRETGGQLASLIKLRAMG